MKKTILISFLSGLLLMSCFPKEPAPNENINALFERFHGKYEAIQSTSNIAVDVNLDGRATTDMLVEIPALTATYQNYLELRIYGPDKYHPNKVFLFTQWWPEQDIFIPTNKTQRWEGEDMAYQPGLVVNYAMQGVPRYFSLSADLKQLIVTPNKEENSFRWQRPESVTVNADDTIQIINKRRLYTSAGVKDVVITTVYKRYTMVT